MCYTDQCDGYFGDKDEKGLRHGVGSITWSDGSSYEGEWINNLRYGNGVFIERDGQEYRG